MTPRATIALAASHRSPPQRRGRGRIARRRCARSKPFAKCCSTRCQNCRTPASRPRPKPGACDVQRGRDGFGAGMNRSGCHQTQNLPPSMACVRRRRAESASAAGEHEDGVINLPLPERCRVSGPQAQRGRTPSNSSSASRQVRTGAGSPVASAPVSVPHAQFVGAFRSGFRACRALCTSRRGCVSCPAGAVANPGLLREGEPLDECGQTSARHRIPRASPSLSRSRARR